MILHQKNIHYENHCKHSFGTYVQAHDGPNQQNNNSAKTLDGIYLQYIDTHQGGHKIVHLKNKLNHHLMQYYSNTNHR